MAEQSSEGSRGLLSFAIRRVVHDVFLCATTYGVFAVFFLALTQTFPEREAVPLLGAAALAVLVSGIAFLTRRLLADRLERVAGAVARVPTRTWLAVLVLAGVGLRVIWLAAFPPVQTSDPASYFALARQLVEKGRYETADSRAYWPPGLPFSLLPAMVLFQGAWFVPAVNNLVLFVFTIVATYRLALEVADERVARIAAAAMAVWPNLAFGVGMANKELLTLFTVTVVLVAYLRAVRATRPSTAAVIALVAGLVLGYTVLTQPSTLLFPALFMVFEVARGGGLRPAAARLVLLCCGMIAVVSPWTVRNWVVLGAFIPVSVTGGVSLYMGNNDAATGGYVSSITEELAALDEVSANRVASERARAWIVQHPRQFAFLALKKQILFLGDDSGGAYSTLRQGLKIEGPRYLAFKALSNAFWLVILLGLTLSLWQRRSTSGSHDPRLLLLMLPFVYFLALHSVFESGGRHHIALSSSLAVLSSLFTVRSGVAEERRVTGRLGAR